MGLDISAHSKLRFTGYHPKDWDYCEKLDHLTAYAYDAFPHALAGVMESQKLVSDNGTLYFGCFVATEASESYRFRAGSYGGYGQWRMALAECFGTGKATPENPFYELVYFADNEGTILYPAAERLAEDFEENRERWGDYCVENFSSSGPFDNGTYYLEKYEDWAHAFKLASEHGLVNFH